MHQESAIGGSRPWHCWLGSDPCPSYIVVQLFFLDMREGNRYHKSVRLFDSRPMLNLAKRDRIFSSMQFPKASSFASIASSNAIVYASRSEFQIKHRGQRQTDLIYCWGGRWRRVT
ncbi:hypothetical protein BHM03_00016970 [Ensete ventricosum]|nr:hypothetical protein BHM03_00016970 [Ensete ventricosum]